MTLIGLWGVADIGPTDAELSRLMSRLRSSSLRTFMQDKVRPFINQRTIERFESEGDDASGKWEQLQLTTGRIRMFKQASQDLFDAYLQQLLGRAPRGGGEE